MGDHHPLRRLVTTALALALVGALGAAAVAAARGSADGGQRARAGVEGLPAYIGARAGPTPEVPLVPFGRPRFQPRTIEAFKDAIVISTRWQGWGEATATGTGTARVNTCEPSCANGRIVRRRGARVVAYAIRDGLCNGTPVHFYIRARVTFPRSLHIRAKTFQLQPDCL